MMKKIFLFFLTIFLTSALSAELAIGIGFKNISYNTDVNANDSNKILLHDLNRGIKKLEYTAEIMQYNFLLTYRYKSILFSLDYFPERTFEATETGLTPNIKQNSSIVALGIDYIFLTNIVAGLRVARFRLTEINSIQYFVKPYSTGFKLGYFFDFGVFKTDIEVVFLYTDNDKFAQNSITVSKSLASLGINFLYKL